MYQGENARYEMDGCGRLEQKAKNSNICEMRKEGANKHTTRNWRDTGGWHCHESLAGQRGCRTRDAERGLGGANITGLRPKEEGGRWLGGEQAGR